MKNQHRVVAAVMLLGVFYGCATEKQSATAGAVVGAAGGAAFGGIADPGKDGEYRTRNVLIGATFGAMAGAVTGTVLHGKTNQAKKEPEQTARAAPSQASNMPPKLSDPKVEAKWVDGKAQGNRWIDGHWEYQITEPAKWQEGN